MVHGNWTHNTLAQLVLHGRSNSQDMVNVLAFEATGAVEATLTTDALAQAWAESVRADWQANAKTTFLAMLPAVYSLPRISIQVVERPGTYEHRLSPTEATLTTGNVGTNTGSPNTMAAAGIIRWKSTVTGKSHRGRTYVPLPADNFVSQGTLITAGVTAYTAFATVMTGVRYTGATPTSGGIFTIYSRPYDTSYYVKRIAGVPTVITLTNYAGNSTNVTTFQVDTILRQQRRRELGVGS